MASIWKHPNSQFLTACYTDKDGKQVKRSTKQTDRRKALVIATEFERVEQQIRRGVLSTLQIQKVFNDLAEKTTSDTILTPSVEKYLRDWLANIEARNSGATAVRYSYTVDLFFNTSRTKRSCHNRDYLGAYRGILELAAEAECRPNNGECGHQDAQRSLSPC
jgi:hypothetical protein